MEQEIIDAMTVNNNLMPFRFKMTIQEVIHKIHPGQSDTLPYLELIYRKKPLPMLVN